MSRFWKNCKRMFVLPAAAAVMSVAGCMSVDYVGQSFPPLAEDSEVVIYSPDSPLADHNYRAIGRVELTCPNGTTQADVRDKLSEIAREHGATVVNIVEAKRIDIGLGAPENATAGQPSWNKDNRNAGGDYIYSNYFGVETDLGARKPIYELHIKALLMVTDSKFKAMEELYRKEREKLEAMRNAEKNRKNRKKTAENKVEKSPETEENVRTIELPDLSQFWRKDDVKNSSSEKTTKENTKQEFK